MTALKKRSKPRKLTRRFYTRPTVQVARSLLGKKLVRVIRGKRLSGFITEVEAYLGEKDPACHTRGGLRTPRNESMYKSGGTVYVYFVYGMHWCFNVVTRKRNQPEAVLIRSLHFPKAHGPARLTRELKIDKKLNGVSLLGREVFIEDWGIKIPARKIKATPRIGVAYAGAAARWKLRYLINPADLPEQLVQTERGSPSPSQTRPK